MSKFYIVEVPEIYTSKMVVMADSAEEAATNAAEGEGTELSLQFSCNLEINSSYKVGPFEAYEIEGGVTAADIGASVLYIGTASDGGSWLLVDVKDGEARLHRTGNGRNNECLVLAPLVKVDGPPTPDYVAEAQRIMQGKEL